MTDLCFFGWWFLQLEAEDEDGGNLDRIGLLITDLIMWRDVAKSTLWFGFGTLCILSSCFTRGINFRCVFVCLSAFSFSSRSPSLSLQFN